MTNISLNEWIRNHYADYVSALRRVEKTRTLLLSASPETAGEILKKAYVFAVLSIRTGLERHQKAFTQWTSGMSLREAARETVYPNQKADWMIETIEDINWVYFGKAIQRHFREERHIKLLEAVVGSLKGVSHRKGGFTMGMSGGYEFICIDSNVAQFAGLDEENGNALEFSSAEDYVSQCEKIVANIPNDLNLPPFLLQWSLYDYMRGEHARHMPFYREVLPEVLFE